MPRKVKKETDICHDSRPCFARGSKLNPNSNKCGALMNTYEKDEQYLYLTLITFVVFDDLIQFHNLKQHFVFLFFFYL